MQDDNLTRDEARVRADLISNAAYRVVLDLRGAASDETFSSKTFLRFSAKPGTSTTLDLLAHEVGHATLNGKALPHGAFTGTRVHLEGLDADNEVVVSARCRYEKIGVGLHRFHDPVDEATYLYTHFEPFDAHRLFACFDQPDIKATFDFEVAAPAGWTVVSNMTPTSRPAESEAGSWVFATTPRISTYITAVAAGPYHLEAARHRDIDMGLYCRRSLAQYLDPEELFEITRQGLDFFEDVFGYPYIFGKYDQLFVPEFNMGAMENAGAVTFNEFAVFRSKMTSAAHEGRANTILHEMAHMWFGDLVTMRWWDDLWLNESFATYMATHALERATRFKTSWTSFAFGTKASARRQDQLPTTHPIAADIPDVMASRINFDGITYSKGASVLRQLVAWVGEDAFFDGLKTYFRRHELANTELPDFLAPLEESSGRDLHFWSKEWIETAGVNTLRPAFTLGGGGAYDSFEVLQEATDELPTLRSHRIAVGLYDLRDGALVRRRRAELDVAGERTAVPELLGEPRADLVLVNDDDLTYAKIRLDESSLETLKTSLGLLDNPLARAICWGAAWDMVRDAELPARDYRAIVLGNIDAEDEMYIVSALLGHTASAISLYGDPANRKKALEELASAALERMQRAEPGSDAQLIWARSFVSAARSEQHLEIVRGVLNGSTAPEGLSVDIDFRWHVVASLAAVDAGAASVIDAEQQRDPTDMGRRHAARARASIPSPEAKRSAWHSIIEEPDLPFATMRAIMGGFHRLEQRDLLTEYGDRYFDVLDSIWQDRDTEVAMGFTSAMYPYPLIGDDLIAATDAYLAEHDVPPPARRLLLEAKDETARALKARAKDAEASPAPPA